MHESSSTAAMPREKREDTNNGPAIDGVRVREDDIESVKAIRAIAVLFRGMAVLMLVLMAVQFISAVTGTLPISIGVVVAEEIKLAIFAGLLWGLGDLAVLWVKSHYDIRASRILLARVEYMVRQIGEADGRLPATRPATRSDRQTWPPTDEPGTSHPADRAG